MQKYESSEHRKQSQSYKRGSLTLPECGNTQYSFIGKIVLLTVAIGLRFQEQMQKRAVWKEEWLILVLLFLFNSASLKKWLLSSVNTLSAIQPRTAQHWVYITKVKFWGIYT